MKLIKLLSNLGYGSRKDVERMLRDGRVTDEHGSPLDDGDDIAHESIRVDDEPIDPPLGVLLMLHKPVGYTCSTRDPGSLVFDLLPARFSYRKPSLSTVGRLDRDTSGLLLLTDDGTLLHRLTSPKWHVPKVYEVELASDLRGDEAALFASGTMMLESEETPLLPATLEVLSPRHVRVTLVEGRYHQVRRMFAAVGNHVSALRRVQVGTLVLGELPEGEWRLCSPVEIAALTTRTP